MIRILRKYQMMLKMYFYSLNVSIQKIPTFKVLAGWWNIHFYLNGSEYFKCFIYVDETLKVVEYTLSKDR